MSANAADERKALTIARRNAATTDRSCYKNARDDPGIRYRFGIWGKHSPRYGVTVNPEDANWVIVAPLSGSVNEAFQVTETT